MDFTKTDWDTSTGDTISASNTDENTTYTITGTVHYKDEVDIREEAINRREILKWTKLNHKDARRSFPNKLSKPFLKSREIKIRGNKQ